MNIESTELTYTRVKINAMGGSGDKDGLCPTEPYMVMMINGGCSSSTTYINTSRETPEKLRRLADEIQAHWETWDNGEV